MNGRRAVRVWVRHLLAVPTSSTVPWRTLMSVVVVPLGAMYESFLPTLKTAQVWGFLEAVARLLPERTPLTAE
jgi:hypothetical protein